MKLLEILTSGVITSIWNIIGVVIGVVIGIWGQKKLTVFSSLHQERAIVIKEMYQKLITMQCAMINNTGCLLIYEGEDPSQKMQELNKTACNALVDCMNFYALNKLYLQPELEEKIDKIMQEYKQAFWTYISNKNEMKGYPSKDLEPFPDIKEDERDRYMQHLRENEQISKNIEQELPLMIEQLKRDFRKIIGIKR